MKKHCNFVVAFATLTTLISVGTSFKLIGDNETYPFGLNGNYSEIKKTWMLNAATPTYLKDFLALYQQTRISANFDTDVSNTVKVDESCLGDLFCGVTSDSCKGHIIEWYTRLTDYENLLTDEWALQMVDAWGKPPEGILAGHINAYGDFDECLQIDVNDLEFENKIYPNLNNVEKKFAGQYCTSYIMPYDEAMSVTPKPIGEQTVKLENAVNEAVSFGELVRRVLQQKPTFFNMLPSMSVCMPNSCSQSDVQQLLVNGLNLMYQNLSLTVPKLLPWPMVINCAEKEKPGLDGAAITVIVLLAILVTLALSAAVVDYWFDHEKEKKAPNESVIYKYFMAFSLYTNTKKWLSTRKSPEDFGCLHGIRFFSTAWVALAHTYDAFVVAPQWNQIDIKNIYKKWTELAVINGTFSVDTFFLMSGMLATYNILKMLDKSKGKFNVVMFYVHRYVRLTPTYAIIVAIGATLISYASNGPFWFVVEAGEENCRKNWWTNLLYINNLVNTNEPCIGVSWYLANDMQFYILSPLIVIPLWHWELMGLILLTIYTIMSCIAPVLVVRYATDAPPALVITNPIVAGAGMIEIYQRPWSRISVFLVGVWLGWILHKTKTKRLNLPRLIVLGGWLCSTGIALAILFGIYPWFDPDKVIPAVPGYFYAGLSRFSWGVSVSWVIFACIKGYGGMVNRFLSWKVFMPLGRVCFCVYLTSLLLQGIYHSRLTVPIKWDAYNLVNLYFAHMVMSFMVGILCTLFFESPFVTLLKLIFDGKAGSQKKPIDIKKRLEETSSSSNSTANNNNNNNSRTHKSIKMRN